MAKRAPGNKAPASGGRKKPTQKARKPMRAVTRRNKAPAVEPVSEPSPEPEQPQPVEPEPTQPQPVEIPQIDAPATEPQPIDTPAEPEAPQPTPAPAEIIPAPIPYAVRLDEMLTNPKTIQSMFAHIANGGDLITFCKLRDVRYSDVAEWITSDQERHKRFSTACLMGQEWVKRRILNELGAIGMVDIRGLLTDNGGLKAPQEWPEDIARAVSGIEIEELYEGRGADRERVGTAKRVKLTDKLRALEMIGKELGMFIDRKKVEIATKLEDLVGGSFGEVTELTPSGAEKK